MSARVKQIARIALAAAASIAGLVFAAALGMILLGDPTFPAPLELSEEAMAEIVERYAQPYAAQTRTFAMRDGTVLAAQAFPAASETTILLVHGVLGSSFPLNRPSGMLREATGAEVVALDLRGHGASGGRPGDVDYTGQWEDDLAEVIARLRGAQVRAHGRGGRLILAGHSMGGGISLRYARRLAQEEGLPAVDGYLLLAPHLGAKSPTTPRASTPEGAAFARLHLPRTLGLALFDSFGVRAFHGLHTLFFNLPSELPLRSYSFRAMIGMAPDDHAAALAAIEQPVLVVVGSEDEAFLADRYEEAIQPGAKRELAILDGADHNDLLTEERMMAAVRRWMAER